MSTHNTEQGPDAPPVPGPRAIYEDASRKSKQATQAAAKTDDLWEASKHLDDAMDHLRVSVRAETRMIPARPSKGWMGLMCRGLGELPDVDIPHLDEFPDARRYRVLPALTILLPITCAVLAFTIFPLALMSPITATGQAVGGDQGQSMAGTIVLVALLVIVGGIFLFVGPTRFRRGLFDAALAEELWFRLGAEHWYRGRRVRACAQFGVAHLINLFVAVVTLGGLALVGGVFMWVYLREVKESGDPRRAAVVSAQFHADYNTAALVLILAVGALVLLPPLLA